MRHASRKYAKHAHAQLIGSSRETITRLFSDFKKKRILEVKGSSLIIRNKSALEDMVGA